MEDVISPPLFADCEF